MSNSCLIAAQMNWTEHLNEIFSVLNFTVAKDERIMADVNYLSKLFQLLNETPTRVIGIWSSV